MNKLIENIIIKKISKHLLNEAETEFKVGDYFKSDEGDDDFSYFEITGLSEKPEYYPFVTNNFNDFYSENKLYISENENTITSYFTDSPIPITKEEYYRAFNTALNREGTKITLYDSKDNIKHENITLEEFLEKEPKYKSIADGSILPQKKSNKTDKTPKTPKTKYQLGDYFSLNGDDSTIYKIVKINYDGSYFFRINKKTEVDKFIYHEIILDTKTYDDLFIDKNLTKISKQDYIKKLSILRKYRKLSQRNIGKNYNRTKYSTGFKFKEKTNNNFLYKIIKVNEDRTYKIKVNSLVDVDDILFHKVEVKDSVDDKFIDNNLIQLTNKDYNLELEKFNKYQDYDSKFKPYTGSSENYHTKIISKEYDEDSNIYYIKFKDNTRYDGELKEDQVVTQTSNTIMDKIGGIGTFYFSNGKKISGNFTTIDTENGKSYSVVLRNGVEIKNIFDYQTKDISKIKTLSTLPPKLDGSELDANYCKNLKNYYVDFIYDLSNENIVSSDNFVLDNLDKIKNKIKLCYNNHKEIFNKNEISSIQNIDPKFDKYKIIFENKTKLSSIIRESILLENQKKQNTITESKIIKNRFDFIINKKGNIKKLRYLFEEKNTLIEKGYNKDIVIENYNKSIDALSQSHRRLKR